MECNLFNGSRASISFKDFSTLNSMWQNLGDEVVSIKDKGLVQPSWRDWGGNLRFISENTHDK